MIKVSRVTPYIPINISQIKFIEVDHIFLLSLIPLFFLFTLSPICMNFSCELAIALNSRPAQIAYAFEEEIRKETQRDVNDVSLCGFLFFSFFFIHLQEKRKKQVAILSVFLSDPNVTGQFLLHLSFCYLCATL